MVQQIQSSSQPQKQESDVLTTSSSSVLSQIKPLQRFATVFTAKKTMKDIPVDEKLTQAKAFKLYNSTRKINIRLVSRYNKTYQKTPNAGHTGLGYKYYPQELMSDASSETLNKARKQLETINAQIPTDISSVKSARY